MPELKKDVKNTNLGKTDFLDFFPLSYMNFFFLNFGLYIFYLYDSSHQDEQYVKIIQI